MGLIHVVIFGPFTLATKTGFMGKTSFLMDFPRERIQQIYKGFSIAMFNKQMMLFSKQMIKRNPPPHSPRLLSQGVRQKAIDFVFVGVLKLLTDRQQ